MDRKRQMKKEGNRREMKRKDKNRARGKEIKRKEMWKIMMRK